MNTATHLSLELSSDFRGEKHRFLPFPAICCFSTSSGAGSYISLGRFCLRALNLFNTPVDCLEAQVLLTQNLDLY